jgi:AcrR family transcriptional regulator
VFTTIGSVIIVGNGSFLNQRAARRRKAGLLATRATTESRIFNGALHAIARQGPKKLTMSDIAAEAGVSGGTLYRYFKNKEEILATLGDHFVMKLKEVLQQAIAEDPEPADRLRVVIDVMLRFWQENPATLQIGQLEAGFTVNYIKGVVPQLSAVLHNALEPVLADSAAVRNGSATVDEVVDLVVRMAFSHYFIPAHDYRDLRDLLVTLGRSAGLEPKKSRSRTPRKAAS